MSDSAVVPEAPDDEPPLVIVVYADGRASVGGVPVPAPEADGDLTVVRAAVLRKAVGMAADRGRALHALAFEPDGSAWPLVIHPDGRVEEDAEEEAHAPAGDGGRTVATLHLVPGSAGRRGPRTETLVLNPGWSETVQTPQAPERFRERLARIAEAGEAGRIEAAVGLAAALEDEVALLFGSAHPHVLQARAVRVHLGVLAHDWTRAADGYLELAGAWLDTSGPHGVLTRRSAANAHYCWLRVAGREEAERIGEAVVRLWLKLPGARRELDAARRRRDRLRTAAPAAAERSR